MYKVFFNDRIVFLTNDPDHIYIEKQGMFYPYQSFENLKGFIQKFQKNKDIKQVYIYSDDLENLTNNFKAYFNYLEAAGGLVFNKKGQFLAIKRFGKWDLPKGKIEKDETIEHAAKREVQEECGIENITIKNSLISTYHTYEKNNINYLKKTYWFTMYVESEAELKPQVEEGITFAKWFDVNDFHVITENTYLSIIDILKVADVIKKKWKPRFD